MTAKSWHSRAGAAIVGGVYNEIVAYLTPITVINLNLIYKTVRIWRNYAHL